MSEHIHALMLSEYYFSRGLTLVNWEMVTPYKEFINNLQMT